MSTPERPCLCPAHTQVGTHSLNILWAGSATDAAVAMVTMMAEIFSNYEGRAAEVQRANVINLRWALGAPRKCQAVPAWTLGPEALVSS